MNIMAPAAVMVSNPAPCREKLVMTGGKRQNFAHLLRFFGGGARDWTNETDWTHEGSMNLRCTERDLRRNKWDLGYCYLLDRELPTHTNPCHASSFRFVEGVIRVQSSLASAK